MRKTIIILFACTAALLAGYASYRGYKVWRQGRMMTLARGFIAEADGRNAMLCLQQVLRANPQNVEACRLMAELTGAVRSPSALLWRSKVVELNPRSLDDRLTLARTAILFRDYETATNALEGVDQAGKKTAAYHNVAGAAALAVNQVAQAEAHFLEAIRLEPTNQAPQLNLATVRLHGTNELDLAEARIALRRIISKPTDPRLQSQALRELVVDALRFKQTETAQALSQRLLLETNSVFADRLLRLNVLQETRNSEFKSTLATFQREAAGDPARIYELATWQMAKTSPRDALNWLQSLPATAKTNQTVMVLTADCYSVLEDWRGLQAAVERQYWAELEFVRHALKARALRGQDLSGAARGEWELALKIANNQHETLTGLLRLAVQWRWQTETEEILWAIVNRYPEDQRAFQVLSQALYAGGQTRPLLMLFSQQLKRAPADLDAKNNLAVTALLLEARELRPHDLAREVYQKAPTNASYVSTYAFSLHKQKKDNEALKVMEQLKPEELDNPSIAGYYGLILKATGNAVKARVYFQWASKARLLPEERKLFDQAKAGLNG